VTTLRQPAINHKPGSLQDDDIKPTGSLNAASTCPRNSQPNRVIASSRTQSRVPVTRDAVYDFIETGGPFVYGFIVVFMTLL
jgi:hypothetical protein